VHTLGWLGVGQGSVRVGGQSAVVVALVVSLPPRAVAGRWATDTTAGKVARSTRQGYLNSILNACTSHYG